MLFEARDLAAHVDGRTIVSRVNLRAEPGSVTAIIGVNGSGKSTLLRALAGITTLAAGDVLLGGVALRSLSGRERARRIAFVSQEDTPPDDLLVRELVALGRTPYARPWERGGRGEHQLVSAALEQVGMLHTADRTCAHLSGGERRRVMLARGLAQDTPVLMLDEPTNHLDIAQQHHLLHLVTSLGRSVLMAIHDLTLAYRYADQVVVLDAGGVLAQGDPDAVFGDPRVGDAFGVRISSVADPLDGLTHLLCSPLPQGRPLQTHITPMSSQGEVS